MVHYCLHQLKIRPKEFLEMGRQEKAVIFASIQVKIKNDEKAKKGAERKGKRR